MHERFTTPPPPANFSPKIARSILSSGDTAGNLYYDTFIGTTAYPSRWDSLAAAENGYNLTAARRGLGIFMASIVRELSRQLNIEPLAHPEQAAQLAWSRNFVFNVLQNGQFRSPITPSPEDDYPWLQYQTPAHYGNRPGDEPRLASKPSFLHFGSLKDKNGVRCTSQLAAPIRLYLNPHVNDTAEVAAELCEGFIAERGFLPRGKFMEDATAVEVEERRDRLLFWLGDPQDLSVMTRLIANLQYQRPKTFKERPALPIGEPVYVNGRELATVRIAQSPINRQSFTTMQLRYLQLAVKEVFTLYDNPRQATDAQVEQFIAAAKKHATQAGWHADRPAFLACQDMSVIDNALRYAQ